MLVSSNDVRQGCGDEKIFLLETKFFALHVLRERERRVEWRENRGRTHVIVGIENARDILRQTLFTDSLEVITIVD